MTAWDAIWSKPQITSDYSLKYISFMQEIGKQLPHHSRVIEVGCGTGQTMWELSRNHTTIGLDISPIALERAKHNCHYRIQGDIFTLPFKDNSFDLVYNSGVIEHFPYPKNLAALKEMMRIAKPGGTVVVIVPNSYCLWYRLGKFIATLFGRFEFGYEEDYTPARLATIVEGVRLTIEKVFGLQALPPLATNDKALLPEFVRDVIGQFERILPKKEWYAYTVGAIAKKG